MEPLVLLLAVAASLALLTAVGLIVYPTRAQGMFSFAEAARKKGVRKLVIRQEQRLLPSGGNSSPETGFLPKWSMHLVCTGWNWLLPVVTTDIFVGICFDAYSDCRCKRGHGKMVEAVDAQLDKLRTELPQVKFCRR